jgi:hypothetical protein
VLLILRNREAGVFYVGVDRRDIQVDEGFGETFPYKQFGSGDMIRCQRSVVCLPAESTIWTALIV